MQNFRHSFFNRLRKNYHDKVLKEKRKRIEDDDFESLVKSDKENLSSENNFDVYPISKDA